MRNNSCKLVRIKRQSAAKMPSGLSDICHAVKIMAETHKSVAKMVKLVVVVVGVVVFAGVVPGGTLPPGRLLL